MGKVELKMESLEHKMDDRMDGAMDPVAQVESRLDRNEKDLPSILDGFWENKMGAAGARPGTSAGIGTAEISCEERYWRCRRSLRLWPLDGASKDKLDVFLLSKLGLSLAQVGGLGPVEVTRVGGKGAGGIRDEHFVLFDTKEARDMGRGNTLKLALLPANTAGVRLKIPNYLHNNFKTFQNAAYQIKQKSPAAKRNVFFDDDNLNLALDVKLSEAGEWQRISPGEARAVGAKPGKGPASRRILDAASISSMMGQT